jgi:hypothetical protein
MVEGGLFYDFQLSVLWSEPGRHWDLHIRSVKTVQEHWEKEVHFPLWALPELRNQMAKMLAEHDGTESIGPLDLTPKHFIPILSGRRIFIEWQENGQKFLKIYRYRVDPPNDYRFFISQISVPVDWPKAIA